MLDQPHIPARKALEILSNLSGMPPARRADVFRRVRGADQHERGKALQVAAHGRTAAIP